MVICLGRGADLHMDQLIPLPLTVQEGKTNLDLLEQETVSGKSALSNDYVADDTVWPLTMQNHANFYILSCPMCVPSG